MSISSVHDFHFVMDKGMKEKLKNLDFSKNVMSLSGRIVKILKVLSPVIKKEHKWGKQRMSRYAVVSDDPDEIREHVHMYVPHELYRELKLLHQDLNFYSIAQLVRELINFFLGLVDIYKNEVIQKLDKVFSRWRSENKQTRLTVRTFIRQLLKLIRFLPRKKRLITIYNTNFSPFWILRI